MCYHISIGPKAMTTYYFKVTGYWTSIWHLAKCLTSKQSHIFNIILVKQSYYQLYLSYLTWYVSTWRQYYNCYFACHLLHGEVMPWEVIEGNHPLVPNRGNTLCFRSTRDYKQHFISLGDILSSPAVWILKN